MISATLMAFAGPAFALTINAPSGLTGTGAFNGDDAYLWAVAPGGEDLQGQTVTSATVSFNNIVQTVAGNGNDITIDAGSFVNMPAGQSSVPTVGNFSTITDNDALGDAFQANITAGIAERLATMSFTSLNDPQSLSITLSASELTALEGYNAEGIWGLEIDPDCHFNVGSISISVATSPNSVPDGGSTMAMLGVSLIGLGTLCKRLGGSKVS